jgi:hypothetical protein
MSDLGPPPPPPPPPVFGAPPPPYYGAPPPPPMGWQQPMPFMAPQGIFNQVLGQPPGPVRRTIRWIGWIVLLGGIGVGAALFIKGFIDQSSDVNALARGPLPAPTLALQAGPQTIFVEGDGLTDDDSNDHCRLCDEVHARSQATVEDLEGNDVPVAAYGGVTSYDFGHEGVAIGTVEIPRDGRYVVRVSSPFGQEVAVGEVDNAALFVSIGLGFGLLFGGIIVGGIMLKIGGRRR